jgi:hypothetical protein
VLQGSVPGGGPATLIRPASRAPASGIGVVGLSWGPISGDIITSYRSLDSLRTPRILKKGGLYFLAAADILTR